jgi:hypothetical protein
LAAERFHDRVIRLAQRVLYLCGDPPVFVMPPLQAAVVGPVRKVDKRHASPTAAADASRVNNEALIFGLFALVLSIAAGIGSIVVVHLLIFLQARGVDFATAVSLGTIFGPAPAFTSLVRCCSATATTSHARDFANLGINVLRHSRVVREE